MKNDSMIDLGVKYGEMSSPQVATQENAKVSYPTLYLPSSTKDMPDFPDGEFYIMCKAEVKRCVETKEDGRETTSCDISVKSICVCDKGGKPVEKKMKEADSEDELDKELTKIADKKKK